MNKKLSIFAILLIVVGAIGSVWSGITAIPYFVDMVSKAEKDINKEYSIYDESVVIDNLDIITDNTNITIKKHNKEGVVIAKKGTSHNVKYDINKEETTLSIKENNKDVTYSNRIKDFGSLFNTVVEEIFSNYDNTIVIYVPNDVNINLATKYGDLNVEDDIFLDSLVLKTSSGSISIPKAVKELNRLDITSSSNITLAMSELLGVKDVNVNAESVSIYSDDNDIFIDNIVDYIPNNVTINQNTRDNSGYDSDINTDIPVAKNLVIDSYNGNINVGLPIEKYKFNFDIKSSNGIDLQELRNESQNYEESDRDYNEVKSIQGLLNKSLENLEQEYIVKIKGEFVSIY